jgi:TPP-dependent trihydroxycyclohexane-1,2-dione (THcHDO) dehydratase
VSLYTLGHEPLAQSEVLGAVNDASAPTSVVCAAGAMPGDLHKLWRTRDRRSLHVEYGFSCMGYDRRRARREDGCACGTWPSSSATAPT